MSVRSRRKAAVVVQLVRGIELPVQFLLSLIAARTLSPEDFGQFTFLFSVQTVVLVLFAYGQDELYQRSYASNAVSRVSSTVQAFSLRFRFTGLLLAGTIVSCIVAQVLFSSAYMAVTIFLLGVYASLTLLSNLILSFGLASYNAGVPLVGSLLSWVCPLVLVLTGRITDVQTYAAALMLGSFVRIAISYFWIRNGTEIAPHVGRAYFKAFNATGSSNTRSDHMSLVLYGLTNQVLARHGDVLVAGILGLSMAAIGSYGLAFQIASTANTFLMLGLGSLGLSRLSESQHSLEDMGHAWVRLTRYAATLAVGPLSLIALLAPDLQSWFFGSSYESLTPLLIALCVAQWLGRVGGGGTNTGALIAVGMTQRVAVTSLFGAALNVVLDFAFIPWLGAYGMVIATAVSLLATGWWNQRSVSGRLNVKIPTKFLLALSLVHLVAVCTVLANVPTLVRYGVALAVAIFWLSMVARILVLKKVQR